MTLTTRDMRDDGGFSDLRKREVFAFGTGESAFEGCGLRLDARRAAGVTLGSGWVFLYDSGNHIDCLLCCCSLLLNVVFSPALGKGFVWVFDRKVCASGAEARVGSLTARLKSCPSREHL